MSKRKSDGEASPEAHGSKRRREETNGVNDVAESDRQRLKKEEKRKRKAARIESHSRPEHDTADQNFSSHDVVSDKAARRKAKEERRARKAAKLAAATENGIEGQQSEAERKQERSSDVNGHAVKSDTSQYVAHGDLQSSPQGDIDAYLQEHDIKYVDATSTNQILRPITKFQYLPRSIAHADIFKKFAAPTPVQAGTWPYLLSGRDVIGVAETGSGKTLAFGIPCIERISARSKQGRKGIQAVIVSPTRELASQIYDQLKLVATPQSIKVCCVYGGVPKDHQREELRGAHIVVATPGRLNDFVQEGAADLSTAEFACLDEADRMLDKGFEDDIRKILSSTAPASKRQTVMFTATWPQSVRDLASTFMNDPIQIYIGRDVKGDLQANIRIEQKVEVMDPKAKDQRLYQILRESQKRNKKDRVLIFCLYKKEATRVENNIRYKGFNVAGIHGDMTQQKRMESLEAFKNGQVPYLVATDVAARGLDIPAVKLVLNMTFPLTADDYVHRIGRTGRAGQQGKAITFFTEHEKHLSGALINVLKSANQPVPEELLKFGTTVKKKEHAAYGAFFKDVDTSKKATKITFD